MATQATRFHSQQSYHRHVALHHSEQRYYPLTRSAPVLIKMKKFMTSPLTSILIAILAGQAMAADPPNIVYILADDMGPGDVSAYNENGKIPTPHIDRIAREGIRFTDAHSNSSVCTPTRYGILTGRYAWRTRLKSRVLQGHSPHLISPERETVASFLKKQGYATACVGKWHLGMDWQSADGKELKSSRPENIDLKAPIRNGPLDVGFDYYFGISASLNMDPHAFIENRHILGDLEFLKDKSAATARGYTQPSNAGWAAKEYEQQDVLARLAEKTTQWIRKNAEQPFFVYLPLPSPHSPIVPSEGFQGKGVNEYSDFCIETDWVVGEVLKTLDELDKAENTIVIFTADNGTARFVDFELMHKLGHYSSLHYRGMKGTLWEGGHRVPFVLRWPEQASAGSVCDQAICTTDLLATCADLFEIKLPDTEGVDSVSFLPAIHGEPIHGLEKRVITHHSDGGVFAVRRDKWKLMLDKKGGSRRWNPKDKPFTDGSDILLFDLEKDPGESKNLVTEYPEIATSLKKSLAEIIQNGRSTPGANQPSDHNNPDVEWPQIDLLRDYFE